MRNLAFVAVAAIIIVAAAMLVDATHPQGCYAGSYLFGQVKGKIYFKEAGKMDIDLDVKMSNSQVKCDGTEYSVDHSTGRLIVSAGPDTCLGKVLSGANLPQPKVLYNKRKNRLSLDLGVAKLDLDQC
jgi:hypothetical protein